MDDTQPGVRSEIEERADARHVGVARAQREDAYRTMVFDDEVGGERRSELLPAARCSGS